MKLFFFLFLAIPALTSAQNFAVKGQITDQTDGASLIGATVIVKETGQGAVTDATGEYILTTSRNEITLRFTFIGYKEIEKKITLTQKTTTLDIVLSPQEQTLTGVEVSGTRYNTDAKKSIQTLEVVNSSAIDNKNATTLDKALDNIAGFTIINNEPQMRAGSGFSSGMGSRVMILLDEMPILRADAGRPAWNLIPMEDVAQIEILKGASSVLFGSAAINGAINVRTAYAKSAPETKAKIYTGFYSQPANKEASPYHNSVPLSYGTSFSHSRKIKKIDFIVAAEFANNDGYHGSDRFLKNEDGQIIKDDNNKARFPNDDLVREEMRVRTNVGLRYHISDRAIVTLNGNVMYSDNYLFNFWGNSITGMYHSYKSTQSHFKDLMYFIDPHFKYTDTFGGVHQFSNRLLYSDNRAVEPIGQDAFSRSVYNSYHYSKTFAKAGGLHLKAGISNNYTLSFGQVFSGNLDNLETHGSGMHTGNNFALFTKLEKSFFKNKNLLLEFGARWEFCAVDDWSENRPIFQGGINYEIPVSHTYFRVSVGQGYRAATIGEKFITTKVGDYGFYPNPELKSETSVNSELAVRQMYKAGIFEGYVDVAGFYQTYNNYIEFFLGPWNDKAMVFEQFGFKYFNTGKASITGVETSWAGQLEISDIFSMQLVANYTYSMPVCRDTSFIFTSIRKGTPAQLDYTYRKGSSNTERNILKYRIQHVAKLDLNMTFKKIFTIGVSMQYLSAMKNVDHILVDFDADAKNNHDSWLEDLPFQGNVAFMEKHKRGSFLLNLRAAVELKNITVAVIMNNVLNTEYALRPMYIEAPRLTTVQLTCKI
ncbi:MAG: TonB-dependent receptor [Bacteroidales bacterium]|jgi:iron complex outermembrane receptor protein|nr:TonB-dependent receptor [Bacteroidales bacterium]